MLILEPAASVLLWEAVRKTPEGSVYHLPANLKAAEISRHWAASLPEEKRPVEIDCDDELSPSQHIIEGNIQNNIPPDLKFEKIITRDLLTRCEDREGFFTRAAMLLAQGGSILLCQVLPSKAQRLSNLAELENLRPQHTELFTALSAGEDKIYGNPDNPLVNWGEQKLISAAEAAGLTVESSLEVITENRPVQTKDLDAWFNPDGSGYGKHLSKSLNSDDFGKLKKLICGSLENQVVKWKISYLKMTGLKN